ncbi:hypothetical protein [Paraburkholderia guartelaensis]|uniref:hypothetical protein n=1 Tax=Paraburkholderia guartelaensis TaxID=2546446 RepID=UPI002AB79247|nr:hypothetical protein [Paraburkholderia guartelaensis]
MKTATKQNDFEPLAALRAEAIKFESITEIKMPTCTAFVVHGAMVACACADRIALRLPGLSVIALLRTPGCARFQPYGRALSRNWLAIAESSPAFNSLGQLFEEAVAFARESQSDEAC